MAMFWSFLLACALAVLPVFGRVPLRGALEPRNEAAHNAIATKEALHRRSFFYAGGQYVHNDTAGGTISINKQYVEQLTPAHGVKHKYPLVFFHGGGDSGVVRYPSSLYLYDETDMCSNGSTNQTTVKDGHRTSSIGDTWFISSTSGASVALPTVRCLSSSILQLSSLRN